MTTEILKPFGPSILKVSIPDEIVEEMNKYVDESILDHDQELIHQHIYSFLQQFHREYLLLKSTDQTALKFRLSYYFFLIP